MEFAPGVEPKTTHHTVLDDDANVVDVKRNVTHFSSDASETVLNTSSHWTHSDSGRSNP